MVPCQVRFACWDVDEWIQQSLAASWRMNWGSTWTNSKVHCLPGIWQIGDSSGPSSCVYILISSPHTSDQWEEFSHGFLWGMWKEIIGLVKRNMFTYTPSLDLNNLLWQVQCHHSRYRLWQFDLDDVLVSRSWTKWNEVKPRIIIEGAHEDEHWSK